MSLYDSASLVMIPSGYKEDKVYSIKPTDGSGDLDFTRSNDTATRVGPDGLIEKVRTNLLTYSEQFDNAAWSKRNVTITANATTAPDGTLTAEKLVENSANAFHALEGNTFAYSAGEHSWSIFAKASERNVLQLLMNGSLNINCVANFNLTTGVVTLELNCQASIENVGNGWFRCSMVYAAITNSVPIGYYSIQTSPTAARATTYLGDGTSGLFLWGAQMTTGVTTPYIPTTTAAVSVGPVADLPRLDYHNPDSPTPNSCPSLLLEPQRTNLITYSEQFDNADWSKTNVTITANDEVSPDGYTNADTCLADGVSAGHLLISDTISFTSATSYSFSVFAKKGTNNFLQLFMSATIGGMFANFDLNNGSVGTLGTLTGSNPTSSIDNYGNGWYRCTINFTATATTSRSVNLAIVTSASATRAESNTLDTSVFLWGFQLEAGSYATSYIPTLGAVSTRAADAASKTGISDLINSSEGVLYAKIAFKSKTETALLSINDGTTANSIYLGYSSASNVIRSVITSGGVVSANLLSVSDIEAGEFYKIAVKYKLNDFALYVNGVEVATDVSGITPVGLNTIEFDFASVLPFIGDCQELIVFPTALTNAELAALTTL